MTAQTVLYARPDGPVVGHEAWVCHEPHREFIQRGISGFASGPPLSLMARGVSMATSDATDTPIGRVIFIAGRCADGCPWG
jgi:hypothetical protein